MAKEIFSSLISCFLDSTLDFYIYFKWYLQQCEIQVLLYTNSSIILGENVIYIKQNISVRVAM